MMTEESIARAARLVYISMPFGKLDAHMRALVKEHRLNLEIGISHHALDAHAPGEFRAVAAEIADAGISTTVHAPFQELFPGAPDRLVREAARARLDAAFGLAPLFRPASVVMHLNFEYRRFGFVHRDWLAHTAAEIDRYAELAAAMNALLCLENVYEESPDIFGEVFAKISAKNVRHCLDVGHLAAFSKIGIAEWLSGAGHFVGQFHLHDNDGSGDRHAPLGEGSVDFAAVKDFIAGMNAVPLVTLEPHSEPDIWKTLAGFTVLGFPEVLEKLPRVP
ncbi:MAG: sugar phosphate isomerase/epimerase [Spirochaetes bacterium]|nr:MAG: sugar phosphate isomerase/epimerase [Spirochaetota bacterium]